MKYSEGRTCKKDSECCDEELTFCYQEKCCVNIGVVPYEGDVSSCCTNFMLSGESTCGVCIKIWNNAICAVNSDCCHVNKGVACNDPAEIENRDDNVCCVPNGALHTSLTSADCCTKVASNGKCCIDKLKPAPEEDSEECCYGKTKLDASSQNVCCIVAGNSAENDDECCSGVTNMSGDCT